ncbi:hypothetical protein F4825DRAFT_448137 [Nemania diffusa]|nr:hypothetical protein F4825DRAFT_448137 [Nemania diffusa]
MDSFKNKNTLLTPSIGGSAQLEANVAIHQGVSNRIVNHELPAPLSTSASPMLAIRQNIEQLKQSGMATTQHKAKHACKVATFIVSGEPDAVKGVTKAVYHDLKDGNKDAKIDFHETKAPYIRVEAPTEEDALALIRTAQRLAAVYLSGRSTEGRRIFVEPRVNSTSDFRISIDVIKTTEDVRPTLEIMAGTPHIALNSHSAKYRDEFSEYLCQAFEEASSLHTSLILRAYLGRYFLQTYKKGKFKLEEFESMVKNPRANGRLDTRLGKALPKEEFNIEATIRLIQGVDSPCRPMDTQATLPGHVIPSYVLESWHDNERYETELDRIIKKKVPTNEPIEFTLNRTTLVPPKLDWKIVATPGDERVKASIAVKQYLETGTAVLQGSHDDFRCYPAVRLSEASKLANKLKSMVMKSIYQFSWKKTGYVVQFTINRRWQSIHDMNRGAAMDTDFDVTIYAQNWDDNSRVKPGETVGKIWEKDLRGLLQDEGDTTESALGRVRGLIGTILDIRDFFEGSSVI